MKKLKIMNIIKKYKLMIFFIIFIFFQLLILKCVYAKTVNEVGELAETIANTTNSHINTRDFEYFINHQNDGLLYFKKTQTVFSEIQKHNGIKYIYVQIPYSNTQFQYIFDSEKNSLGNLENLSDADIKSFLSKESFHTKLITYKLWGKLITGFSPIINRNGDIIGTVGVDIDERIFYFKLWHNMGTFLIFMFVVTLVFIHSIRQIYVRRKKLNLETIQIFNKIINTLTKSLAKKSDYTWEHSEKVAKYSVLVAKEMGFDNKEELEVIHWAGLLHDIGKIGISESILYKNGKLNDEEYNIIKQHPTIGREILSEIFVNQGEDFNINRYEIVMDIVTYHHERWDGKGYPDQLKETEIPLIARIVAICDAYEAMLAKRPYKKAMSKKEAREQIIENSGKQFDPDVVQSFLNVVDKYYI